MSYDKEVQALFQNYLNQFEHATCPDCKHRLTVTSTLYHADNDDLMSKVELDCLSCHWSTTFDKPYAEAVKG